METLNYFKKDIKIHIKNDNSPVTEADLVSNKIIYDVLNNFDSNINILSEENIVDWEIRKKWNRFWLVDPLDGTKEFINNSNDYSINIALIVNNKPTIGVIYIPADNHLYYSEKNKGSWKIKINNLKEIELIKKNSEKIECKKNNNIKKKILTGKNHKSKDFNKWIEKFNIYKVIYMGSSKKFCFLAEGLADYYVRFRPSYEWDIAAGDIILQEANGSMLDILGNKITYNLKEDLINPYFIAQCK